MPSGHSLGIISRLFAFTPVCIELPFFRVQNQFQAVYRIPQLSDLRIIDAAIGLTDERRGPLNGRHCGCYS